ncbi:MAG: phosphomannomutase/phosphoglucomutase [bacterium]
MFDPKVFKAYDVRGIYPTQINSEFAYKLGFAYADLRQKEESREDLTVVVSRDMRLSSPELSSSLINGLLDSGVNVVDIGIVSTPTMYFAVGYLNLDGGIQVSASHNPKDDNGFKLVRKNGVPVSEDTGIYLLRDAMINTTYTPATQKGTLTIHENITQEVVATETQTHKLNIANIKPLKIVVDAGNAMGAVDVAEILKTTNCELIPLNFELDGSFPVHQPDLLVDANLVQLQKSVIKHQADLGIAPDGDGDRYFFVDEKGEIIRQEILRGIMAQISLKDYPGSTVGYDIRPGKITLDMILEAGGKPIVTRVGHSLIKESMIKNNAIFGGESSGHYFYKFDFGTFEAPTLLVLKFLQYISEANKPVSEIIKPLKRYFHSGEINSVVEDTKAKIYELKTHYHDGDQNDLDGITITYPEYWFNVRPSNTEPKLRLNLEATTKTMMEQKRDEVLSIIRGNKV